MKVFAAVAHAKDLTATKAPKGSAKPDSVACTMAFGTHDTCAKASLRLHLDNFQQLLSILHKQPQQQ